MKVEIDKIRKLSKQRENENWEFRSFLKSCDMKPEKIDSIVNGLYKKISSQIDCRTCANCCKEMQPETWQAWHHICSAKRAVPCHR